MYVFVFNDTATTEIYTLSLHDALPISVNMWPRHRCRCSGGNRVVDSNHLGLRPPRRVDTPVRSAAHPTDRKSTRLNSSHANISYAVFCLKKKNFKKITDYIITRTRLYL